MVALEGKPGQIIFSLDSKGPDESLDDYLPQLLAYCISAGKNLVATTNGSEFRVYNANDLVFQAIDIASLDLQFSELRKLLHKDVAHISLAERIRSLNDDVALGRTVSAIENENRKRIAVQNSDFVTYLEDTTNSPDQQSLPSVLSEAFQIQLKHFPANELYSFILPASEMDLVPREPYNYNQILRGIA